MTTSSNLAIFLMALILYVFIYNIAKNALSSFTTDHFNTCFSCCYVCSIKKCLAHLPVTFLSSNNIDLCSSQLRMRLKSEKRLKSTEIKRLFWSVNDAMRDAFKFRM